MQANVGDEKESNQRREHRTWFLDSRHRRCRARMKIGEWEADTVASRPDGRFYFLLSRDAMDAMDAMARTEVRLEQMELCREMGRERGISAAQPNGDRLKCRETKTSDWTI